MNRIRFLLAVPRRPDCLLSPELVAFPEQLGSQRVAIWIPDETPRSRLSSTAIVVGALFSGNRGSPTGDANSPSPAPSDIVSLLLKDNWGAYVALVHDPLEESVSLFLDPSGLLPVYHQVTPDHHLFTTDPELLVAAPSYPDILDHLLRPELRQVRTCLVGVEEVRSGSLVSFIGGRSETDQLWTPDGYVLSRPVSSFAEASDLLRHHSIDAVGAWARFFGKVGVAASGGVDSSLVCAALAKANAPFDCITLATGDRSGDERHHASAVAEFLGVDCLERFLDPLLFDPARSASFGLARPSRRAFLTLFDDLLEDARLECDASIVMDGNLGDNLFCYLHSAAPVADRLRANGLGSSSFGTLLDMCRLTDCSLPVMIAATCRRLTGRGAHDPWPADWRLLNREQHSRCPLPLTPWLDNWTPDRSGRTDHLCLLMHAQNHINGLTGPRSRLSPLASQPLVELCLSIPTWLWAEGGINRAVARAAFATDLPSRIVRRTSKSGPDSLIRVAFAKNRAAIAERLLDGQLASNGLLDRPAVEAAMKVNEFTDLTLVERILDVLEAENWVRSLSE